MSQQNVETVRRVYEGWARGDFSDGHAFHPDVEFEMPDWPEAGSSRGLREMAHTWRGVLGAWEDFRAEPEDFIDTGPHVVVLNRIRARGSGVHADAESATVWTLHADKVVRFALYWDRRTALEVVGLGGEGQM